MPLRRFRVTWVGHTATMSLPIIIREIDFTETELNFLVELEVGKVLVVENTTIERIR